jgi:hypothetical protein
MKKIRPKSRPQKPPPSAPAFPQLARLRFLLADLPAHDRRVEDLDELLVLQVRQHIECLLSTVGRLELPHG